MLIISANGNEADLNGLVSSCGLGTICSSLLLSEVNSVVVSILLCLERKARGTGKFHRGAVRKEDVVLGSGRLEPQVTVGSCHGC